MQTLKTLNSLMIAVLADMTPGRCTQAVAFFVMLFVVALLASSLGFFAVLLIAPAATTLAGTVSFLMFMVMSLMAVQIATEDMDD